MLALVAFLDPLVLYLAPKRLTFLTASSTLALGFDFAGFALGFGGLL